MVRIYRYILVVILIALISWGVWYVISNYGKKSDYEDGVLVMAEQRRDVKESESKSREIYYRYSVRKDENHGTGYSIY